MLQGARDWMGPVRRHAADYLSQLTKECRTCRECQGEVSPLDNVCPNCGVAFPVRIPISPSLLVTAFAAVFFIMAVRVLS